MSGRRTQDPKEPPNIKKQKSQKLDFKSVDSDVIRCICACIVKQIQKSEACDFESDWEYSAFDDTRFCPRNVSIETVQQFFSLIHGESQMEFECMIVVLIYIERLARASENKFRICSTNWKLVLCTCMMLASKIWDDFSMVNKDFAYIVNNKGGTSLSVSELNLLELTLLKLFDFNVEISAAEYDSYHSIVQRLITSANCDKLSPLKKSPIKTSPARSCPVSKLPPLKAAESFGSDSTNADDQLAPPSDFQTNNQQEQEQQPLHTTPISRSRSATMPSTPPPEALFTDHRARCHSMPIRVNKDEATPESHPRRADVRAAKRRTSFHNMVWEAATDVIKRVFSRNNSLRRIHAEPSSKGSMSTCSSASSFATAQ